MHNYLRNIENIQSYSYFSYKSSVLINISKKNKMQQCNISL